jgi:hypothetical protein
MRAKRQEQSERQAPESVRIAEDDATWLSTAATKGAVAQNDHILLAVQRPRNELGATSRIKPATVIATAKASKYRLTPPRTAAGTTLSIAKAPSSASRTGRRRLPTPAAPQARSHQLTASHARGITGASPHAGAHEGLTSTQSGSRRAESTASSSPARMRRSAVR